MIVEKEAILDIIDLLEKIERVNKRISAHYSIGNDFNAEEWISFRKQLEEELSEITNNVDISVDKIKEEAGKRDKDFFSSLENDYELRPIPEIKSELKLLEKLDVNILSVLILISCFAILYAASKYTKEDRKEQKSPEQDLDDLFSEGIISKSDNEFLKKMEQKRKKVSHGVNVKGINPIDVIKVKKITKKVVKEAELKTA